MRDLNSKDLNSINLNLSDYKSSDFIYKDSTCNVKIQLNFFFFTFWKIPATYFKFHIINSFLKFIE